MQSNSIMEASALENFKCPVCKEYFQKSVFQCPTGHSVCETCKAKLETCPYCSQSYTNTRNFTLESILPTIKDQCKNENCTEIIPLHTYAQHVNQECPVKHIKCKIASCAWSSPKLAMSDHIKTIHKSRLVQKLDKLKPHQITNIFIEHKNNIFFVHRYQEDAFIVWTAEPIISVDVNNLYLVVKMITPTGGCHTLRQPISEYMEDSEKAKGTSVTCMLKSKAKGEFLLSIEDENNATVTA